MKGIVVLATVVLAAVAAAWLTFQNHELVTVHLILVSFADVPLWGVLLGSFLCGGVVVALILSWPYTRLRLRARSQARHITRLEQEVHGLRTLPLPDEIPQARQR